MTKIYIAFYDDEEGGSRENWNTFYTPWVAALTREGAELLAKEAIKNEIAQIIKFQFNIDLTQVTDESTLSPEVQEELEYLRERAEDKHIEIQEGELTV